MIVGNDIVALDGRSGRSAQPVFYSKIIKPGEQALYDAARFPHLSFSHFVWLCWAVKEAVFKCITRQQPDALFWGPRITITELAPLDAAPVESATEQCELFATPPVSAQFDIGANSPFHYYSVLAHFEIRNFQARAAVNPELILAIATPGEAFRPETFHDVQWGIRRLPSADQTHHSAAVREFVLEKLQHLLPGSSLQITKAPAGYPIVTNDKEELPIGLSFSHHENWVSYAFTPLLF